MADRYLLESGAPDGYLLEDGSGVLLLETPPPKCLFNVSQFKRGIAMQRSGLQALGDGLMCAIAVSGSTWNPADMGAAIVLSNSNKRAGATGGTNDVVRSATSKSTGKVSFETTMASSPSVLGFCNGTKSLSTQLGSDADGVGYQFFGGSINENGATIAIGSALSSGDRLHWDLDIPNKLFYVAVNGTYLPGQDPNTNTGGVAWTFTGDVYIATSPSVFIAGGLVDIETQTLIDPVPTGYTAWG